MKEHTMKEQIEDRRTAEPSMLRKAAVMLVAVTLIVVLFNAVQLNKLKDRTGISATGAASGSVTNTNAASAMDQMISTEQAQGVLPGIDVSPKGTPEIYGKELGVSFDDIKIEAPEKANAAIKKLGALDQQITLTGADLERYIAIASQISCEYCCGAPSIIFADGKAACGCAHSFAMRGVAKYLIKNHGAEYTNDEILEELGKWKTLFFPGKLAEKAAVLKAKGIELNYINIASNKYRGIENEAKTKSSNGQMVGGC